MLKKIVLFSVTTFLITNFCIPKQTIYFQQNHNTLSPESYVNKIKQNDEFIKKLILIYGEKFVIENIQNILKHKNKYSILLQNIYDFLRIQEPVQSQAINELSIKFDQLHDKIQTLTSEEIIEVAMQLDLAVFNILPKEIQNPGISGLIAWRLIADFLSKEQNLSEDVKTFLTKINDVTKICIEKLNNEGDRAFIKPFITTLTEYKGGFSKQYIPDALFTRYQESLRDIPFEGRLVYRKFDGRFFVVINSAFVDNAFEILLPETQDYTKMNSLLQKFIRNKQYTAHITANEGMKKEEGEKIFEILKTKYGIVTDSPLMIDDNELVELNIRINFSVVRAYSGMPKNNSRLESVQCIQVKSEDLEELGRLFGLRTTFKDYTNHISFSERRRKSYPFFTGTGAITPLLTGSDLSQDVLKTLVQIYRTKLTKAIETNNYSEVKTLLNQKKYLLHNPLTITALLNLLDYDNYQIRRLATLVLLELNQYQKFDDETLKTWKTKNKNKSVDVYSIHEPGETSRVTHSKSIDKHYFVIDGTMEVWKAILDEKGKIIKTETIILKRGDSIFLEAGCMSQFRCIGDTNLILFSLTPELSAADDVTVLEDVNWPTQTESTLNLEESKLISIIKTNPSTLLEKTFRDTFSSIITKHGKISDECIAQLLSLLNCYGRDDSFLVRGLASFSLGLTAQNQRLSDDVYKAWAKAADNKIFDSRLFMDVYYAPDLSILRHLGNTADFGLAQCTLPPGEISQAVKHRTVKEEFYIMAGHGWIWLKDKDGKERIERLRPGAKIVINTGDSFQFRNTGDKDLKLFLYDNPIWPGPDEAIIVDNHWDRTNKADSLKYFELIQEMIEEISADTTAVFYKTILQKQFLDKLFSRVILLQQGLSSKARHDFYTKYLQQQSDAVIKIFNCVDQILLSV